MVDTSILATIGKNERLETAFSNDGNNSFREPKKPPETQNNAQNDNGNAILQKQADKNKIIKERYINIVREEQGNIRRAKSKRSEFLKGIQAKKEPEDLLLIAAECIAYMTGDLTYFRQAERDIKKNYCSY